VTAQLTLPLPGLAPSSAPTRPARRPPARPERVPIERPPAPPAQPACPPTASSSRATAPGIDVTPVDGRLQGVEVDLTHDTGAWSVRLTRDRATGQVALIVVDHATGNVAVAEVLRQPDRPPEQRPAHTSTGRPARRAS
jgi:hypothetical protein